MTTATRVQAESGRLGLDARLALAAHGMDLRLDRAAVAFEVNTAHIPNEPLMDLTAVDLLVPQTLPTTPTLTPASPIAACLRRAHARILRDGWTTGTRRDEQGAVCLYGAIRAEAHSPGQAAEACAQLLDTIRAQFPDALTVPAWNDEQRNLQKVLNMLDQAASDAEQQGR